MNEKLWTLLVTAGRHDLVNLLHDVEMGTKGFGSVVIPLKGFSEDDNIHNAVIDFLKTQPVNLVNPVRIKHELETALHGRSYAKGD